MVIASFWVVLILVVFLDCKQKVQEVQNPQISEPIAKVQFIQGDVYLFRGEEKRKLQINEFLFMSDAIQTEKNSIVDIIFRNKGIVRLNQNTKIELQVLSEDKIQLRQDSGTVINHLKKLSDKESYTITTPTSIAAVRGTSFIVKVKDSRKTEFALIEGKIEIQNQKGQKVIIDKPGEITIEQDKELKEDLLKPLSKESIQILKEIAASDVGNVQEYASFIQEIKNSTALKEIAIDEDYEKKVSESVFKQNKKSVEKVQSAEKLVIKRNTQNDPLKIPVNEDYRKDN